MIISNMKKKLVSIVTECLKVVICFRMGTVQLTIVLHSTVQLLVLLKFSIKFFHKITVNHIVQWNQLANYYRKWIIILIKILMIMVLILVDNGLYKIMIICVFI